MLLFVPSLSSCHEKATVTLYLGRIRNRLGVVHFQIYWLFLWLLTTEFGAFSKAPSTNNHRKAPYRRTQQRVRWDWELNLDHAIVNTRSPLSHGLGHAADNVHKTFSFPKCQCRRSWGCTAFPSKFLEANLGKI